MDSESDSYGSNCSSIPSLEDIESAPPQREEIDKVLDEYESLKR